MMGSAAAVTRIEVKCEGDVRKVGAIDPCTLCAHGVYRNVDDRCREGCELRGRRFFEVLHAAKNTA